MERVTYPPGQGPFEKQVTRRVDACLTALAEAMAKKYSQDHAGMRTVIDSRIGAAVSDFGARLDIMVAESESRELQRRRDVDRRFTQLETDLRAYIGKQLERAKIDLAADTADEPARRLNSNGSARAQR